jgi:hypothetical protein
MGSHGGGRGHRRPRTSAMDVEGVHCCQPVPRMEVIAVPAAAPGRGCCRHAPRLLHCRHSKPAATAYCLHRERMSGEDKRVRGGERMSGEKRVHALLAAA